MLVLDGATGQVRARVPLPRSVVEFHAQWATHPVLGHPCTSDRWEWAPLTIAPIVAEDGSAYLQLVQTTRVDHGYCSETDISRADDHVVQLLRVTPAGLVSEEDLYRFVGPRSVRSVRPNSSDAPHRRRN